MKSRFCLSLATITLALAAPGLAQTSPAPAAQASAAKGQLIRVTEKDAAWAATARKEYPLTACVVSDEKLGSMGKAPEYIYRVAGQPDRLVTFCCSGCEEDFLKDPAKHLAKLDAAKDGKAKGGSAPKEAHKGHH
jgi:hypothetical protein